MTARGRAEALSLSALVARNNHHDNACHTRVLHLDPFKGSVQITALSLINVFLRRRVDRTDQMIPSSLGHVALRFHCSTLRSENLRQPFVAWSTYSLPYPCAVAMYRLRGVPRLPHLLSHSISMNGSGLPYRLRLRMLPSLVV